MNEFKQAKEDYNAIPIPEKLNGVVQAAIQQGKRNSRRRYLKQSFAAIAACFAVLFGVLNLSPTAAAVAADIKWSVQNFDYSRFSAKGKRH